MISNKTAHKPRVVDCIVITPEVHNNGSDNQGGQYPHKPYKKTIRSSKSLPAYTTTVLNRVKLINKELAIKNIPYRYETQNNNDRLILAAVFLDNKGNIAYQHTKEVSPENFESILDSMYSGTGFLFDD